MSVAERDATVVGYVSWDRGRGYGADGELRVGQMHADDADALRSLLTLISRFGTVTPTVAITTSGVSAWQHLLRDSTPAPVSSAPYSLAVLDPAAFALPEVPQALNCRLPFRVQQTDGSTDNRTLVCNSGKVTVEPGDGTGRALTPNGLALTFAGAQTSATLRALGHISGDKSDDNVWDMLACRGPVVVHDYF